VSNLGFVRDDGLRKQRKKSTVRHLHTDIKIFADRLIGTPVSYSQSLGFRYRSLYPQGNNEIERHLKLGRRDFFIHPPPNSEFPHEHIAGAVNLRSLNERPSVTN